MPNIVYTVGHSNYDIQYFLELLDVFAIDCLIDIRSIPASSYCPHFNKDTLAATLRQRNILYMHFEREFGAKKLEPGLLDANRKVDFAKVQQTRDFLSGVERLKKGTEQGYTMALMCVEGHPLECHRFSMISGYLHTHGFTVRHILKDKTFITHEMLEAEALKKYAKKIPQPTIFEPIISQQVQLKAAYKAHNEDVAWQLEV
jgi:uncharacterized protein (DUF488 family)